MFKLWSTLHDLRVIDGVELVWHPGQCVYNLLAVLRALVGSKTEDFDVSQNVVQEVALDDGLLHGVHDLPVELHFAHDFFLDLVEVGSVAAGDVAGVKKTGTAVPRVVSGS